VLDAPERGGYDLPIVMVGKVCPTYCTLDAPSVEVRINPSLSKDEKLGIAVCCAAGCSKQ
jgi:hypothetical protein